MDSPTISVVVPVYNTAKYLTDCLQSIAEQTYRDLEVLCVNDGSTDDSLQILRDFAAEDQRFRVIDQPNAGVSAARNAGLRAASGEYLAFVDGDDMLEADLYETLINLARKYNADIAHCGYRKISLDGAVKDVSGTECLLEQNGEEALGSLLRGEHFVGSPCNKLYRRAVLKDVRFDENLKINEDVLFNVQSFMNAGRTVFYDVPKYHYFERNGSACGRTGKLRKAQDCAAAAERILTLCRDTGNEGAAVRKLGCTLCGLYRAYLLDGMGKHGRELQELKEQIAQYQEKLPDRMRKNYFLMRRFPYAYRIAYPIYDRIRVPNWDI